MSGAKIIAGLEEAVEMGAIDTCRVLECGLRVTLFTDGSIEFVDTGGRADRMPSGHSDRISKLKIDELALSELMSWLSDVKQ